MRRLTSGAYQTNEQLYFQDPSQQQQSTPPNQPPPTENKNPTVQLKHPFQLERMEIKDPEYMSEVPKHLQNKEVPGFPSTILTVGKPGSGKTNFLINFLTKKNFWYKFYDKIYLLGPTVKSDKLYKHLDIPDDQIVTEPAEFITKLEEWTEKQIEAVKDDANTAPKTLFVFEDITSYYHTAQNNQTFTKCFNAIRHHKASALANIHKVKALQRTPRMSCMHILIWPVNKSEIKQIYEDWGPRELELDDFIYLCIDAWKKDEFSEKPFLYINMYADESKRYRKCFTHLIDVTQYEGLGKRHKQEKKEAEKANKIGRGQNRMSPYQKPSPGARTMQTGRGPRAPPNSPKPPPKPKPKSYQDFMDHFSNQYPSVVFNSSLTK